MIFLLAVPRHSYTDVLYSVGSMMSRFLCGKAFAGSFSLTAAEHHIFPTYKGFRWGFGGTLFLKKGAPEKPLQKNVLSAPSPKLTDSAESTSPIEAGSR